MFQGISLAYAPPFGVVISFFANACVWLIALGVWLVCGGFASFESGAPHFIASLHLFVIGFVVFVMFGALSQMLPVLAGVKLWRVRLTAAVTQLGLNAGLVLFLLAFTGSQTPFNAFAAAAFCLACGGGGFLLNALLSLRKIAKFTPTIAFLTTSLALFTLLFACGVLMLGDYGGLWALPHWFLRLLHIFVGAFGGVFALVLGVCLQVLPMFYVAKPFPKPLFALLVPLVLALIFLLTTLFASNAAWQNSNLILAFSKSLLCGLCALFGVVALFQLKGRKRRVLDDNIPFFYAAFSLLALFGVVGFASVILVQEWLFKLALIALFCGFLPAIIFAMFYKIITFLAWFHLNFLGVMQLPNIKKILPSRLIRAHFFILLTTLCTALVGFFDAEFARLNLLVGVGFLLQGVFAFGSALACYKCYFQGRKLPKFQFETPTQTAA